MKKWNDVHYSNIPTKLNILQNLRIGQIFELILRGDKCNYLLTRKWIHNSLSYKDSETYKQYTWKKWIILQET